jgi:Lipid A 3-O-deacylase (PagL)
LANDRSGGFVFIPRRSVRSLAANSLLLSLSLLAAGCLLLPLSAHSQETETSTLIIATAATSTIAATDASPAADAIAEADDPPPTGNAIATKDVPPATSTVSGTSSSLATGAIMTPKPVPAKAPHASDISFMAMLPYGDYRLFSATIRCNAWTGSVEYDRNSWGHFLRSRVDYSVEVIPILLLTQPAVTDFWGNGLTPAQKWVPGVSISPFGFRFLWRSNKSVKPYVIGKLGAAVFTQKAFSEKASYVNFNVQTAFGLQFRMTDNWDLRVEPFQFFHVSNGYLAASNPGMDEIAVKFGVTYHLNKGTQVK